MKIDDTDSGQSEPVDVAVLSVAEDTRDARFHRILAALQEAGLSTTAVGVGDPTYLPTASMEVMPIRPSPARRIPIAVHLAWQADAGTLVTLDPAAAVAAWPVARIRGRRLVVDVHEDYAAIVADRAWAHGVRGLAARVAVAAATFAARHADLTIVADDHVPPRHAPRRLVVRNIPDATSMPTPAPRSGPPRAVYVGALTATRGLDSMLAAVAAAPAWHLDLVGDLGDRDEPTLRSQVADLDLVDRVTWHRRLPPEQAWEVARGAWVGLALLAPTPAYVAAMPTKLYEYAMMELPVLATDLPRMRRFITDNDLGTITSDAMNAASQLRRWGRDPSPLDGHVAAAATWRRSEAAESQFSRFGAAVALLGAQPRRPIIRRSRRQ